MSSTALTFYVAKAATARWSCSRSIQSALPR